MAGAAVRGDDLLYRFFDQVLKEENEAFAEVPQLLLTTMGIWWPPELYERWPLLLPWVVRDPSCRGNRAKGIPDAWSSPDASGYLRDDNSLIKSLPKSLSVRAPVGARMRGARMGNDFVACHVWRVVPGSALLASRLPQLNSFVPNLVWLPRQIAKLTDREGSLVQRTLQAMSVALYRYLPVDPMFRGIVDDAWALLPAPDAPITPLDPAEMNWFEPTEAFLRTRQARVDTVVKALDRLADGHALDFKVVASRYTAGLPSIDPDALRSLRSWLTPFTTDGAANGGDL